MLDKKTNEIIDSLIKKLKDNNLGSIKLSNKITTIEISNNFLNQNKSQNTQNNSTVSDKNIVNKSNDSLISIDSPMVGIIYLTPKPSSPPFAKTVKKLKRVILFV